MKEPTASEIIRCLKYDGFTLEQGAKYCRDIALQVRFSAYTHKPDEQAYLEAAQTLEARAKAERLAEENVEQLQAMNEHLFQRVRELEQTIVALQSL